MKTDKDLMTEHKTKNPLYDGTPAADLPEYPEHDDLKSWAHFERQQARVIRGGIGVKLDDWLEENKDD